MEENMSRLIFVALFMTLLLFAVLVTNQPKEESDLSVEKVEGVKRIMMHQPTDYSFLVLQPDSPELKLVRAWTTHGCCVRIIEDIKDGELPWVLLKRDGSRIRIIEIHIRSVTQIHGGEWIRHGDHRRVYRGQTTILQ